MRQGLILSYIRRIKNSKVAVNSSWIIAEQVFQLLASLVIGIITARYLGPSNYGSLNYTASFVSFCTTIASLGMDSVVIKKMIEEPEQEGNILGGGIVLRFFSSLLCSVSVVIVVWLLNINDTLKVCLVAVQSLQLIFTSVHLLDSWFQRYLNSKYVSIAKIIACVIVSSYKVYLLATSKSLLWFAFSNSLNSLVIGIVLIVAYRKCNGQRLKPDINTGRIVLNDSYHFILSGLMSAIYGQMDKIMLGSMVSDVSVGYYTTASALCSAWLFVPNAIITSFRPKIMELKESGDEEAYQRRLKEVYALIIWLCLGVSVLICLFGRFAIYILYGESYLGSVPVLQILIWSETFAMIGSARGIWVLCEHKNKYVKYYLGIGAIVNLVLNSILIPIIGEIGAAIATLITQIVAGLISPMFFRKTRVHTFIVIDAFLFRWKTYTSDKRR